MKITSITYARASVVKQTSLERVRVNLSCLTTESNRFKNIKFLLTGRHREYNANILNAEDFNDWPPYLLPTNMAKSNQNACYIGRAYEIPRFQLGRPQPTMPLSKTCAILERLDDDRYIFQCWIKHEHLEIYCLRDTNNDRYTHQGQYIKLDQDTAGEVDWL